MTCSRCPSRPDFQCEFCGDGFVHRAYEPRRPDDELVCQPSGVVSEFVGMLAPALRSRRSKKKITRVVYHPFRFDGRAGCGVKTDMDAAVAATDIARDDVCGGEGCKQSYKFALRKAVR